MTTRLGKIWAGAIVVAVVVALVLQIPQTATDGTDFFTSPAARVANLFCYFTIASNLAVAAVAILRLNRWDRRSEWFGALHTAALLCITVTAVVYRVALADEITRTGVALATDTLFHVVVPGLAVVGWLAFGPRGLLTVRSVVWSLLAPAGWAVLALVRGALVGWYPYPFIDVGEVGYATAAFNMAVIGAVFMALGAAAVWVDRRLASGTSGS